MFHPASLLLVWCCLLFMLQCAELNLLLPAAALMVVVAGIAVRPLFLSMLRRSRWLFLTMIVLFVAMTPGVLVLPPWNPGLVTREGLTAAAEHATRLAAMLALLAILLGSLDQRTIVAGLFILLRPLAAIAIDRERISVRLLLVLDFVAAEQSNWRTLLHRPTSALFASAVVLPAIDLRARDIALSATAIAAAVTLWVAT